MTSKFLRQLPIIVTFCILLCLFAWQISPILAEEYPIYPADCGDSLIHLTNTPGDVFEYSISGNNIAWEQMSGLDWDIFFWDGLSTTQVTNNNQTDFAADVDGNNVVWEGDDGNDDEIFFWNGTTTTQITNNNIEDRHAKVSGNNVVWSGDGEIYFWNGSTITQVTNNAIGDAQPAISGSNITWVGNDGTDREVFFWDGSTITQITDNAFDDNFPHISGNYVLWDAFDGTIEQVYLWDGVTTRILSPGVSGSDADIQGNVVVWRENATIHHLNLATSTETIIDFETGAQPTVSGSNIAFTGFDGTRWDLYYWNGTYILKLTDTIVWSEYWPQISGTHLVWNVDTDIDKELFYLDVSKCSPIIPPPEETPEVTPEITPEVTPELTPEVTPEITPEVTPEVTPELTPEVTPVATDEPDRVTICHVAGRADDPANYVILELPIAALNGHFDNNGTANAGHEGDFIIESATDTARCGVSNNPEATDEPNNSNNGNRPNIEIFDPAISKIGFLLPGQVGVTGEQLEWIVTVSNSGNVSGLNVAVTDTLITALQVDRVDAPGAVVTINGQTVSVTYAVLNPGESRQFSIFTTVLDGVEVSNTACVNATNQATTECAEGNAIAQLPQTGESPFWRQWVWLLLLLSLTGILFLRRKFAD